MYKRKNAEEFNQELAATLENFRAAAFPITEGTKSIDMVAIEADTPKANVLDPSGFSELRDRKKTFSIPIKATFVYRHGDVELDRRKIKIGDLPMKTAAGTFIVDGTEFKLSKMLRLRSGVYTEVKQNGQIETKINLEKGYNLTMKMDPGRRIFQVKIDTSHVRLYSILKHMGVSNAEMTDVWGEELFQVNKLADRSAKREFLKFVNKYMYQAYTDTEEAADDFRGRLDETVLDAKTTEKTLGKGYSKMDIDLLLRSSGRILEVMRDKKTQDNKDDMYFAKAFDEKMMIETDYLLNRKKLNNLSKIFRIKMNNPRTEGVRDIVKANFMNDLLYPIITQSSLSSPVEYVNPLNFIEEDLLYTKKGEGGIQDDNSITDKARELYPSQAGFVDPVNTPESKAVGVNVKMVRGVHQEGDLFKKRMWSIREGKEVELLNDDLYKYVVAFPGEYDIKGRKWVRSEVKAIHDGQEVIVKPQEVDYAMMYAGDMFSPATNLIPFLDSDQGNRAAMGARMIGQTILLQNPDQPYVQSIDVAAGPKISFEESIARETLPIAMEDGRVSKISKDNMTIEYASGKKERLPFYKNYKIGGASYLNTTARPQEGDRVKKGDLLMESNFTQDGTLALGKNLNIAYMAWNGMNSEDAFVITESAANALSSEHLYTIEIPKKRGTFNLSKFRNISMGTVSGHEARDLDDQGIIKKGSIVTEGTVMAAYLQDKDLSEEDRMMARIHNSLAPPYRFKIVHWEKEAEGKVNKIVETDKAYIITVRTVEAARLSDKLAGRHGNKGVISEIIPDEDAPYTKDGKRIDIILAALPVQKRLNIGQNLETLLGRVAEQTDTPIKRENFQDSSNFDEAKQFLKDNGIDYDAPEEHLTVNGELTEEPVYWGSQYILKLKHKQEKGFSARSYSGPASFDRTPTSGGKEGGKAIDPLTLYALMGHGAKANLRDISIYKSQNNPEFWRSYITGSQLPTPSPTFAYDIFMDYLKGAGIMPKKTGNSVALLPLKDRDILGMSSGAISEAKMLKAKSLIPENGGLFDVVKTGGTKGDKWTHIKLNNKIPNPVFEDGITRLLDLTQNEYKEYISEDKEYKGKTGGTALEAMLKDMNLKEELETLKINAIEMKGTELNRANRKLRFLNNMVNNNIKPSDLFLNNIPVVPPTIRPVYPDPDTGNIRHSDLNDMYKDVILTNNSLNVKDLPKKRRKEMNYEMYNQVKRLYGLVTDSEKRKLNPKKAKQKGILETIAGQGGPKTGYFQHKVVKKRQNLSGQGVVAVDTDMDIDEMGLPEDMAFKLYEPVIQREFVKAGLSPSDAAAEVSNKTERSKRKLMQVMEDRLVLLNRPPSLHKYGIMAFKPKLVPGKSVRMPLMVVQGFNMDFDGDKALIHRPVTAKAEKEAYKMLPSRNIIHPTTGSVMNMPAWEDLVGLYKITKKGKKTSHKFTEQAQAVEAFRAGTIKETDVITLDGKSTTMGRELVSNILPGDMRVTSTLTRGSLANIVKKMVKDSPGDIGRRLQDMKLLGDRYATQTGASFHFKDMKPLAEAKKIIEQVKLKKLDPAKAKTKIEQLAADNRRDTFYDDVDSSGAKGQWGPVGQMIGSPVQFRNMSGRVIPFVVENSYVEGLTPAEYWAMSYGARQGTISTVVGTEEPGAFSKELVASMIDMQVTVDDCGTKRGASHHISSPDVMQRYPAVPIRAGGKTIVDTDTVITPEIVAELKRAGVDRVTVRTPLKCRAKKGICQKCYGEYMDGKTPAVGDNIGAISAGTMGEPLVQMAMKVKHTGATIGSDVGAIGALDRIKQVTHLPKEIPDRAVVAQKGGFITKVKAAPIGGWDVSIGERNLYVPSNLTLQVKKGDKVSTGQVLTDGNVHPMDIYKAKGAGAAMNYISDELTDIYRDAGVPLKRVTAEVLARSMGRYSRVKDPGSSTSVLPGDYVDASFVNWYNENTIKDMPVSESTGKRLAEAVGPYKSRQQITEKMAKGIQVEGLEQVRVYTAPIEATQTIMGIDRAPLHNEDWILKLNFRDLSRGLRKDLEAGAVTQIAGPDSNLFTRYVYGPSVIE